MRRAATLRPEFARSIPERMDSGVLYISRDDRTASHLCCCGCEREVVTPLDVAKWQLTEHGDGSVSLMPSIGNWSFPCKSHYFVLRNRVSWAGEMSPELLLSLRRLDREARAAAGRGRGLWQTTRDIWSRWRGGFSSWFRR